MDAGYYKNPFKMKTVPLLGIQTLGLEISSFSYPV